MWTPKRIVILGGSFALFFLCFLGYGFSSVGRIDGLPPLPEQYRPTDDPRPVPPVPEVHSKLEARLVEAFGPACAELNRPIRLDIRSRGMLLSAVHFTVMDDGRLSLMPISVAVFGKDPRAQEISIIKGDVAYIKFDRPVRNYSEINGRKIMAADISGKITVVNNRKRKERDQDLRIAIPFGPLHYDEKSHKIWTEDHIELKDFKSTPEPHVVRGKGMEMELAVEPAAAGQPAKQGGPVGGVKWVVLRSDVDMTLHTDGKQNFFDTAAGPGAKAKADAPKRSVVRITTPGRFRYDMSGKGRDVATFETPPLAAEATHAAAPQVRVHRQNFAPASNDRLACARLELRIKRRDAKAAPAKEAGESFQVEAVHATGPDGEVVLTSDAEKLDARGGDFFHDAIKGLTVLKGNSGTMVVKDDSEIRARELHLQKRPAAAVKPGQPPAKDTYDVRAAGPGRLHFRDVKEKRTLHAFWTNTLTLTRDRDEDLVSLLGDARFVDEAGGQTLSADELKVWLDPEAKTPAAAGGGRKPRHLEANRNVQVKSREMSVSENNRLVVWFKDEPPARLPAAPGPAPAATPAPAPPPAAPGTPVLGAPAVPGAPPRPFDLKARSVQARVLRGAAKNTIDELFCEGAVVVTQAPAKPAEKGTEVKGDTLKMNAQADGCYVLDVIGDVAQLHTDKITIYGPQVVIDQHKNMAWVVGDGAMTMESQTNFQGDRLKDPVPMNVHWNEKMFFDGSSAEFYGGIQATQDNSRLKCQQMQVTFDRVVSLKQGARGETPARVRYMVCTKDVEVEERVNKGKEFVKYQHLAGTGLRMEAVEAEDGVKVPGGKTTAGNRVTTTGPGSFRVVEAGGAATFDPVAPAPKAAAKPAAAKKDGLKMTYVAFQKQMNADSSTGVAAFWENVRVLHVPVSAATAEAKVDLGAALTAELPEGGLYLRSDRLRVMDKATDGKPNKRMEATGNVRVQGRDFDATADVVMYDEAKDQIVFESKDGPATMRKFEPNGKSTVVSAKQILYNRKTKETKTKGTDSISGTN